MKKTTLIISILFISIFSFAQEDTSATNDSVLRFLLTDSRTQETLPYANILLTDQQKGTISNESGWFSFSQQDLNNSDSIRIQYIGYKTLTLSTASLSSNKAIELEEDFINLSEAWVYGNPPKAKDIVKKIIEHRKENYKSQTAKSQVFVRNRENTHFKQLDTKVKRNSISELDEQMIHRIVSRIPRDLTSFTDFLGHTYTHKNAYDSLKISPLKTVSLQEIEIAEMDQFGKIFENLFKDTEEDEYWKVKSGILAQKLDIEEDSTSNDEQDVDEMKNKMYSKYFAYNIKDQLKYASLADEDAWEFLYKTGKYKYELSGGTKVNGEDVFIIDFHPRGGMFVGRIYVSTTSYAILKADYKYGEGKNGRDIQLLGVGYHENEYSTSVTYEKIGMHYHLKYLSRSQSIDVSFERNIALLKKRKRFLRDKKLKEIKLKLAISTQSESINELLFLNHKTIETSDFNNFEQAKTMDVIYVDHFSDDIWKGYPIIEPTKQMRAYKKLEIDWSELGEK